jgi:hypothetical protein
VSFSLLRVSPPDDDTVLLNSAIHLVSFAKAGPTPSGVFHRVEG